MDGILCIDKPAGWTSHDVVARVRRLAGQRKIGHTGTLDPFATGLLVLCLGKATRLVEYMAGHDKHYRGVIQLGARTETDDSTGAVVETRPVKAPDEPALRQLEARFTGDIEQRPPAYSAISVGGRRAYALARAGEVVELAARPVVIHRLELTRASEQRLGILVECGAGTYIRSLARDIGEVLGCGAYLCELRRERVGPFGLEDAWTLDEVSALAAGGVVGALIPLDEGMTGRDAMIVSERTGERLAAGARTGADGVGDSVSANRIYDAGGRFVGVGVVDSGEIRALKVLSDGN